MNELALITAIRRASQSSRPDAALIAAIGDDCAIVRPNPREDLLFTTDLLIEDVHFHRSTHTGVQIGWKALARGLSDIAAMAGQARYALVSLALPEWACPNFVRDLYKGLNRLAALHGVSIIGGDLSRNPKLTIDIVVVGAVARGRALRRNTARPGDIVCVSGPLGRAAARNYLDPVSPRLDLAKTIRGKATAGMDLSDGLALDLHRLCLESGVAARLDENLPVAPGATLEQALAGGEDYELLCTFPAARPIPKPFLRAGLIEAGKPGRLTRLNRVLQPRGWDPLQPL